MRDNSQIMLRNSDLLRKRHLMLKNAESEMLTYFLSVTTQNTLERDEKH